jgi:anaerobic ribonucleoside-triphosphate reductase activating protein
MDMLNSPGEDKPSLTVWFSGCKLNCVGCHNPGLQTVEDADAMDVNDLIDVIGQHRERGYFDTVVFLGGEPLDQNELDMHLLCKALKRMGIKIFLYTGREMSRVPYHILSHLDKLKTGPYEHELRTGGFPASSNQKLYTLIGGKMVCR